MMKVKEIMFILLILFAISGCGGPPVPPDYPGRGEGDIPLGRVRGSGLVKIAIREANGSVDTMAVNVGAEETATFYHDPLANGETIMTVQSSDPDSAPKTYTIQTGETQRFIINISFVPPGRRSEVRGLQFAPVNSNVISVGTTLRLSFIIQGSQVQGLTPTVWVDGGIGSLNGANMFTAVTPGEGVIRAELMGYTAELPITVTP